MISYLNAKCIVEQARHKLPMQKPVASSEDLKDYRNHKIININKKAARYFEELTGKPR